MLGQEHILRSLQGMTDLRQLLSLCNQENQPAAALIEALFGYEGREDDWLPAACEQLLIWPFFAENPDYIEHGLNGRVLNGTYRHDANQVLIQTLAILAEFRNTGKGRFMNMPSMAAKLYRRRLSTAPNATAPISALSLPSWPPAARITGCWPPLGWVASRRLRRRRH